MYSKYPIPAISIQKKLKKYSKETHLYTHWAKNSLSLCPHDDLSYLPNFYPHKKILHNLYRLLYHLAILFRSELLTHWLKFTERQISILCHDGCNLYKLAHFNISVFAVLLLSRLWSSLRVRPNGTRAAQLVFIARSVCTNSRRRKENEKKNNQSRKYSTKNQFSNQAMMC